MDAHEDHATFLPPQVRFVLALKPHTAEKLLYHIHTAILFTWSDYKTLVFPVTAFACATAPVASFGNLIQGIIWVWTHVLLCDTSNQCLSLEEDAKNRPWRPLPAGRITEDQLSRLRWLVILSCLTVSASYGRDLVSLSAALALAMWIYGEGGLSHNAFTKNLCNAFGYTVFHMGAIKIMGTSRDLDSTSTTAISLAACLILTTIHTQDFQDVEGDAAIGRVTFPIYAPELSRLFTLLALMAWSTGLVLYWAPGIMTCVVLIGYGGYVGIRYYTLRSQASDQRSYILFNVWLALMQALPLHSRFGVLVY